MKSILSTKKLSPVQKDQLLRQGLHVVDYDAIAVTFLDFDAPKIIDNAIFTSQQAVRSFLEKSQGVLSIKNCFCVGEKNKIIFRRKWAKSDRNWPKCSRISSKHSKKL
jgi:uroporphyrinogen-III synthase